jgi:hypothetical protein
MKRTSQHYDGALPVVEGQAGSPVTVASLLWPAGMVWWGLPGPEPGRRSAIYFINAKEQQCYFASRQHS